MSSFSQFLYLSLLLLATAGWGIDRALAQGVTRFGQVGVEMKWTWDGEPLAFGAEVEPSRKGEAEEESRPPRLAVTRADFLVSKLALRRADGTWLETSDWFVCFKGAEGKNRAMLEGVPTQVYTGLRFQVGVPTLENHQDPNQWPVEHALNSLGNGLHWGWQGGYIFMALEGHWRQKEGTSSGFSYHLAEGAGLMQVRLEGALDLTHGGTINLELDVAKILGGLDPAKFGESTHSRVGDERALTLRQRAEHAFSLTGIASEVWQDTTLESNHPMVDSAVQQPIGTPFLMRISSRLPKVKLPLDNQLTMEGVALGKALFHEPRLSFNNRQSCASCHDRRAAFADSRNRFSLGAEGLAGTRNAMPLFNLAWQKEFFWNGRAQRLRDQVLEPIQDPVEMHLPLDRAVEKLSGDAQLISQFKKVFGSPEITPKRIGLVLEQFLLTLVSQDSRFDQAVRGEAKLTALEQRGLELFVTEYDPSRNLHGADCFHCHGGNLFSNQGFANNGLDSAPLAGRSEVTGQAADWGKFRVPSLRNIAVTAPYMHDGRFATLEQVIDHYDHGVQGSETLDPNLAKHPVSGLKLSAPDKTALAAFLGSLTDDSFLKSELTPSVLSSSKP